MKQGFSGHFPNGSVTTSASFASGTVAELAIAQALAVDRLATGRLAKYRLALLQHVRERRRVIKGDRAKSKVCRLREAALGRARAGHVTGARTVALNVVAISAHGRDWFTLRSLLLTNGGNNSHGWRKKSTLRTQI